MLAELKSKHPNIEIPSGEKATEQKCWDDAVSDLEFKNLLSSGHQLDSARLLAASSSHSGAWLHALPLPQLGTLLDPESVRTGVALRLGSQICQVHKCRCGKQVDELGHHGLACQRSMGRHARHSHLNDIIKRALSTAGVPSILEPLGLDRGDGRRPDGISVFPFTDGKSLCWDATVSDTFCQTSLLSCAINPGSAANRAEERKIKHYESLLDRYRFTPISIETTGVYGTLTEKFIKELGRRIRVVTGEPREASWLRQRLSIAIVRGNALSIIGTQPNPR